MKWEALQVEGQSKSTLKIPHWLGGTEFGYELTFNRVNPKIDIKDGKGTASMGLGINLDISAGVYSGKYHFVAANRTEKGTYQYNKFVLKSGENIFEWQPHMAQTFEAQPAQQPMPQNPQQR